MVDVWTRNPPCKEKAYSTRNVRRSLARVKRRRGGLVGAGAWGRGRVGSCPAGEFETGTPRGLADLVERFVTLLQTKARVCSVELKWGRAERVDILEDSRLISRSLLGLFLTAMQAAGPGATLLVDVGAAGDRTRATVSICDAAQPNAVLARIDAPRVGA